MKHVLLLMLGLAAGTASFAGSIDPKMPASAVVVTTDNKLNLLVDREKAMATITLRDNNGHVLYHEIHNVSNGLRQKFNIDELASGTYQITITVGKETVVKTFVIDEQPAQKQIAVR